MAALTNEGAADSLHFRAAGRHASADAVNTGRNPRKPNRSSQIGSAGLPGVRTKILSGDPSKAGFYTIVLSVPAHTTIQGHSHGDDRMATVVSGHWRFGYGDSFDASALKIFCPGVSTRNLRASPILPRPTPIPSCVVISGVGPTDTRYVYTAHAPKVTAR